jgi:hypothetical protein
MQDKPSGLPRGYILDASDTAALVLRRLDGSSRRSAGHRLGDTRENQTSQAP